MLLQQQAKNKHAIGQIIDSIFSEDTKCEICGATAILKTLDTKQKLCLKDFVQKIKEKKENLTP